ncbi:unnamed protein product [Lupinus luteus]|uniref:Uncharacterized protein n=1 Tax=Lupinus luteus TaxID=3873 RepID=A0AAV1WUD5_LUPLU
MGLEVSRQVSIEEGDAKSTSSLAVRSSSSSMKHDSPDSSPLIPSIDNDLSPSSKDRDRPLLFWNEGKHEKLTHGKSKKKSTISKLLNELLSPQAQHTPSCSRRQLSGGVCVLGGVPSTRLDQQAPGQLKVNTIKVAQAGA